MCIQLWRRYICPRARNPQPLQQPAAGWRATHPRPKPGVFDHHLVFQEDNIFRENVHDPNDRIQDDMQIHWIKNIIRCAHPHYIQCHNLAEPIGKIQYINGSCPSCTGSIDVHVEQHTHVLQEWDVHPRIPKVGEEDMDIRFNMMFEGYKEYYLLELMKLIMSVLKKPYPINHIQGAQWQAMIENCWPETFCKVKHSHLGDAIDRCECIQTKEEWRVNMSTSMRKNEANAVLSRGDLNAAGSLDQYYADVFWAPSASNPTVLKQYWQTTARADALYQDFPPVDFPDYQMAFVNIHSIVYAHRYARLQKLSSDCRRALSERGAHRSQRYPDPQSYTRRHIRWFGIDDWDASLGRRHVFLDWIYRFLALDAGLDEELMMYLAGGLLAVLNPWPDVWWKPLPSHPEPEVLDTELAAYDLIQESVYELEYHWPLDGNKYTAHNLIASLDSASKLYNVIDRNRKIVIADAAARNSAADNGLLRAQGDARVAEQNGDVKCVMCLDPWDATPNHEPVRMQCCGNPVGKRCVKELLAKMPIRTAGREAENRNTWAIGWRCPICRGDLGAQFKPLITYLHGPVDVEMPGLHERMESRPQHPSYWTTRHRERNRLNGGRS
ncbi:hypothetical protein CkaCkLH20_02500 [Colletotrichum karsti]|uniref:RING-type domain-containing protein n=1 Tax=Colletotrichum karsti TaxID=1095194 RepID=A0A9P6LKS1_9PEZI|nr:uncharacterized protein CkaCkLH20_02500 [Colletotrichum karsti]KAF9879689.1 hypothetical protein CkaCkLH20_02500 [Colletotrichum karsti]